MVSEFSFVYLGEKKTLKVRECKNWFSRGIGLMFKTKSSALLFRFNRKTKEAIHSFFCLPFVAIWFLDDEIIEIRKVSPWRAFIRPPRNFDVLLEIPSGNEFYNFFVDELERNI